MSAHHEEDPGRTGEAAASRQDDGGRQVSQAFAIGLFGNTLLALVKLGAGFASGSLSLTADGWHSLSDMATNAGAWVAHRFARKPPDEDHHYGHGNAEALAGLVIGAMLVAGGFAVGATGITSEERLREDARGWALAVACLSVLGNVALAWITSRSARVGRSQSLKALARDNLSDALSGLLVVLAILLAGLGLDWAEPVAAVVIGALIVVLGFHSLLEGLHVLMDRVPDTGLRERLGTTARAVQGVRGVQTIRVHPLGDHLRVDLGISVDGALTVEEGHRIAHEVEERLQEEHPDVGGVHVHVGPHRAS